MENTINIEVKKLSEIEAKPLRRNRTFFNDLDIIYGHSQFPDRLEWGMPKGKISLWAGTAGVGKSRLCIEVAKKFSTLYTNGVVLYFQTEASLEDFASWANDTNQYDKIYCSGENKIDRIIQTIYKIKPKLIFIDSVNEIEEFETGNKKEARRLIKGADGKPGLKQVTHDVGAHTILLGQFNQDGKTIKGGTSLPHLVDIALNLRSLSPEEVKEFVGEEHSGMFRISVGEKHRHGSKENFAWFQHHEDGVENWSIRYQSNPKWQETFHDAPPPEPPPPPRHGYRADGTLIDGYNPDGTLDQNSDRYKAGVLAYSKTPEGKALMKKARNQNTPSLYEKIGQFFEDVIHKE